MRRPASSTMRSLSHLLTKTSHFSSLNNGKVFREAAATARGLRGDFVWEGPGPRRFTPAGFEPADIVARELSALFQWRQERRGQGQDWRRLAKLRKRDVAGGMRND